MRVHGTLIKWNDERGFGFVALPQTEDEIFVHISAFPKDGTRPRIGETISFEVRTESDGRKRAVAVGRPARKGIRKRPVVNSDRRRSPLSAALTAIVVIALGFIGFWEYTPHRKEGAVSPVSQTVEKTGQQFKCDGRTHCSQMTSCDEAIYFLKHCPGTQMDGDGDGEPCEQQWCN